MIGKSLKGHCFLLLCLSFKKDKHTELSLKKILKLSFKGLYTARQILCSSLEKNKKIYDLLIVTLTYQHFAAVSPSTYIHKSQIFKMSAEGQSLVL